jgi:hypothetical protein
MASVTVVNGPWDGSGAEWRVARAETLASLVFQGCPSTWCTIVFAASYALYTKSSHTLLYKGVCPSAWLHLPAQCIPRLLQLQGVFRVASLFAANGINDRTNRAQLIKNGMRATWKRQD